MKRHLMALALAFGATIANADTLKIAGAYVPVAPPGVMAHAAYLTLENTSEATRSLIGVTAEGYGMTHLHESKETDGVAVMSMVHQLDIAPGQKVELKPGGFHIMLMRPSGMKAVGDTVPLTLSFANGQEVRVEAVVKERDAGS